MSGDGTLEVRQLTEMKDFQRCVELQVAVWGYDGGDMMPRKIFLLAQRIGGQLLGAFDGELMVGFAMALPGYRDGVPYLHSQMLAVLPEYRNRGLGRRMKLAQREDAIRRGFKLMEWTFDPLEIRNAYLNIRRLGAIVRRYAPDFYGPSSSPLQGGLPTDRLYAEWWLLSGRVEERLQGRPGTVEGVEEVVVPGEVSAWKQNPETRGLAAEIQSENRERLQSAFARGLAVVDYERDNMGAGRFVLGPWEQGSE